MIQTNFLYRIAVVIRRNDVLPSTTPLKSTHKPEVALVASKPDFRFIVISGFYPFLARFVNQRTLIVFPNNQQNDSDDRGLRTRNLRHGAFTWRHFRFIIAFYPFLAERERTRVPDVIFARSVRGRAEEKRAALEGFPVATSVHGGRDRTVRG